MQLLHARQQPQGIRNPDPGLTITGHQKFMDPDAAVAAALLLMDHEPIRQHASERSQVAQQVGTSQGVAHSRGFIGFGNLEHVGMARERRGLDLGWACTCGLHIGDLSEQIFRCH